MPLPVEARKEDDKTEAQFAKLEGSYSPELIAMVRSCMALDPLVRPQSVFSMQKVLQAAPTLAPQPEEEEAPARAGGWRGLVGRFGGVKRKAAD
jgi:hypothetical protein